jgi:hypothetical protein
MTYDHWTPEAVPLVRCPTFAATLPLVQEQQQFSSTPPLSEPMTMLQYAAQPPMLNTWPRSRSTVRQVYAMPGLTQYATAQDQNIVASYPLAYNTRNYPSFSRQSEVTHHEPLPQYFNTPLHSAHGSRPSHLHDFPNRQTSTNYVHIHAGPVEYIIRRPMTEAEDDALGLFILAQMRAENPDLEQEPQAVHLNYASRDEQSLASPPCTRPGTPRLQASHDDETEGDGYKTEVSADGEEAPTCPCERLAEIMDELRGLWVAMEKLEHGGNGERLFRHGARRSETPETSRDRHIGSF